MRVLDACCKYRGDFRGGLCTYSRHNNLWLPMAFAQYCTYMFVYFDVNLSLFVIDFFQVPLMVPVQLSSLGYHLASLTLPSWPLGFGEVRLPSLIKAVIVSSVTPAPASRETKSRHREQLQEVAFSLCPAIRQHGGFGVGGLPRWLVVRQRAWPGLGCSLLRLLLISISPAFTHYINVLQAHFSLHPSYSPLFNVKYPLHAHI